MPNEHLSAQRVGPASFSAPGRLLQRQCACGSHAHGGQCDDCRKKRSLQRTARGAAPLEVPAIVHDVLREPGHALHLETRAALEPRFGHDFSQVRVHTGTRAEASARAVGAHAYTVGPHVVFDAGQYRPFAPSGQRLLAHELTHTIQQRGHAPAIQTSLRVDAIDSAAESEATRVADGVASGYRAPSISRAPAGVLGRQPSDTAEPDFTSAQQRGGQPRATSLDAGHRGADQVRVAIIRYMCDCAGRDVTRTSSSTRGLPRPGITLTYCRGRTTVTATGDVVPSSITTGQARARLDVNIAPGSSGVGGRGGLEAEVRNTGREPEIVGRGDVRVGRPGGLQGGLSGEVSRGTESGEINTRVGVGVDVGGGRIGVDVTNPQDSRRGGNVVIGGNLPGQDVSRETCRECRCPIVYECFEDVPPRDYEQEVTYDVTDRRRLRYYFQLDTNNDTRDPVLRSESTRMLDQVERLVAGGAQISAITGFASPEDNRERPTPNESLSLGRGERVRQLLAARLGSSARLPEPQGGGELFGRVATIDPGSRLADAMIDTGFGDPEDVSVFLIGDDIPNTQLADQFLALLKRVDAPDDRLRLFGVDSTSPAAPRLLAAMEQFVARRGRGRRPWEGIFGYLRFASVEVSQTRPDKRMEQRRTQGSLTPMAEAPCTPWARRAERESAFGPRQPDPVDTAGCPRGAPRNRAGYDSKCDYS